MGPRRLLRALFDAAIAAADPRFCVPPHLPKPPSGRTVVIGAGKAAASMAKAVEDHWPGPLTGLVLTRYGHGLPCRRIEILEAGHPLPDAAGLAAAQRILALVQGLSPTDLVLALFSGGGSSLLSLPAAGIALTEKRAVTAALLKSGAAIGDINTVRKHLSAIKGGRLALTAAPAPVIALTISDVPGDDPAVIASGPTVADPTTSADAIAVLTRYRIEAPASVMDHLRSGRGETPKPGDSRLTKAKAIIIARPKDALEAAAAFARKAGHHAIILGDAIEGEARDVARVHAALAVQTAGPTVLLSGGETTVTVRGKGRGGRNAEFLLALAIALDGHPGIHALAADTDGIDGSEDNAGAIIGPETLLRAEKLALDAPAYLADNDAYGFFQTLGDLVNTGPTRTNVNDFRAIFVGTHAKSDAKSRRRS